MLFNSIEFVIFLPIVFILYWFLVKKNLKIQNSFLLIVSYVFYGWWDWRFLTLIVFSSFVDFAVGINLGKQENQEKRRILLLISILVNLGFLMFFKYFNFFAESFVDAFSLFGQKLSVSRLRVILPVGISFYTFQTLSYSIDVYKKKLEPTKDIIAFFAFVSFFPQLVAGPIERATNLLPQFYKKRYFNYDKAVDGLRQILWGLFKKMVIADNCAVVADNVFNNYQNVSSITLIAGAILFTFQIYGDFSGYSDIAIGTSRLFGFNLMRNFAFPYFSRDIGEFWRRWHISLSTWFRDYLYIPLGGSRGGTWTKLRNTFIIFLVSGFWHGANWTFVFWGGLNALYFFPLLLTKKNRQHVDTVAEDSTLPSIKEIYQIGSTFFLTVLAWIFFRSENLAMGFDYIRRIVVDFKIVIPRHEGLAAGKSLFIILPLFVLVEWIQRKKQHALEFEKSSLMKPLNWLIYYSILFLIIEFAGLQQSFIYFQF